MKNLYIDSNGRSLQCSRVGYAMNFSTGEIDNENVKGVVRIKNVGSTDAVFRYARHTGSDGIVLSSGETEYFYVEPGETLEVVSGTLNIMW